MFRQCLLCYLSGLLPVMANGQTHRSDTITDRTHQLREVTITESRRQHVVTSTAPLHILDRQQMLSLGVTDVADALHRIPGVTLRDYGGAGGMKTVSVRGFGAKHTGVSYDGVMLSDCQSGEIDLSRYSLENVDHLSLVIGDNDDIFIPARNASTPALLNIQTIGLPSDDTRPHLVAQMKTGSFGYVSPFLRYEQSLGSRFAISAIGEYTYAENDYPYELQNGYQIVKDRRTNSRMNSGHGELNFVWNTSPGSRLSGKVYYYDNDRQLPGQVRYYTNLSKETIHDQNFFGQLLYQTHNQGGWSLRWHAKFNWNASIYQDPLTPRNYNDAGYWQREAYTSAAILYVPTSEWAFDYSADYSFNNLTGPSILVLIGIQSSSRLQQSIAAVGLQRWHVCYIPSISTIQRMVIALKICAGCRPLCRFHTNCLMITIFISVHRTRIFSVRQPLMKAIISTMAVPIWSLRAPISIILESLGVQRLMTTVHLLSRLTAIITK